MHCMCDRDVKHVAVFVGDFIYILTANLLELALDSMHYQPSVMKI